MEVEMDQDEPWIAIETDYFNAIQKVVEEAISVKMNRRQNWSNFLSSISELEKIENNE